MFRALPRFSRILLASALVAPSALAVALAQPAPPSPVPVPYPLTNDVRAAEPSAGRNAERGPAPIPCLPIVKCKLLYDSRLDGPAQLQLTVSPGEIGAKRIEVLAWSWGADPADRGSADPQEGGEVAQQRTIPGRLKWSKVTLKRGVEASTKPADAKPAEPGKLEIPNLMVADPLPSGTLVVRVARRFAAQGQHIPEVKLSARGRDHRLQDVVVTECAATDENTETCLLSYRRLGG